MEKVKILCVEDNPGDARIIKELFNDVPSQDYEITFVDKLEKVKNVINDVVYSAILLDLSLPDSSGLDTLEKMQNLVPDTPIIVLTGLEDEKLTERIIQSGAQDYLSKNKITTDLIMHSIRHARNRHVFVQEIKKAQQQFKNLIEKNSDGIIVVNREGVIRYINSAAEKLLGRKRTELIGESFGFPIVSGESTELTINRKDNDFCIVEMRTTEIIWNEETVFLASLRDITENNKLQQIIIEEHDLSEFLGDLMAHDINNLNHGILSYLDMVMELPDVPQTVLTYLKKSLSLAEKISRLVSNIQKFVETAKEKKQLENIDFKNALLKAIEIVKAGDSGKEINITHDFLYDQVIVKADKLLESVLDNLMGNSVKYNTNYRVDIDITHKISDDKQWYTFYLEDNGIGIPDANKDKMFGRFARGVTETKIYGHGVGLMLVKKLVESYGGRVWVENCVKDDYTQGSVFILLLPVGNAECTSLNHLSDDDQIEMINQTFQSGVNCEK